MRLCDDGDRGRHIAAHTPARTALTRDLRAILSSPYIKADSGGGGGAALPPQKKGRVMMLSDKDDAAVQCCNLKKDLNSRGER